MRYETSCQALRGFTRNFLTKSTVVRVTNAKGQAKARPFVSNAIQTRQAAARPFSSAERIVPISASVTVSGGDISRLWPDMRTIAPFW